MNKAQIKQAFLDRLRDYPSDAAEYYWDITQKSVLPHPDYADGLSPSLWERIRAKRQGRADLLRCGCPATVLGTLVNVPPTKIFELLDWNLSNRHSHGSFMGCLFSAPESESRQSIVETADEKFDTLWKFIKKNMKYVNYTVDNATNEEYVNFVENNT